MEKGQIAKELFLSGLNCSQSVALAFKEELGISETEIKKILIGFGGGFGRQRLVCGAVSGMTAVLGYVFSDGSDKAKAYQVIQKACAEFKSQIGSLICGEILKGEGTDNSPSPSERTAEYYKKRPCAEIVAIATEITQKVITEEKE